MERGFLGFLFNSFVVAAGTICISVPLGTLAAYGLARTKTKHANKLLFGLLAIRMLPQILLAIPFFVMASWISMIDTYAMMIMAMVAINQPFTIWLMRSFFVDVPVELDEAAMIDGCNRWQAFWHVVLPAVRPGLAVTSLFSMLLAYNEFLFALILTGSRTKTLPVAIAEYGGEDINYWSLSAAGAIGIMLPAVIFTILVQRHLIRADVWGGEGVTCAHELATHERSTITMECRLIWIKHPLNAAHSKISQTDNLKKVWPNSALPSLGQTGVEIYTAPSIWDFLVLPDGVRAYSLPRCSSGMHTRRRQRSRCLLKLRCVRFCAKIPPSYSAKQRTTKMPEKWAPALRWQFFDTRCQNPY